MEMDRIWNQTQTNKEGPERPKRAQMRVRRGFSELLAGILGLESFQLLLRKKQSIRNSPLVDPN